MDTQSAIEQATLAFYLGNKAQARALLKAALNQEPHNENAWLLYADVAENEEHSIYCLERVLKTNPANEAARKRLAELRGARPTQPAQVTSLKQHTPTKKNGARGTLLPTLKLHQWAILGLLTSLVCVVFGLGGAMIRSGLGTPPTLEEPMVVVTFIVTTTSQLSTPTPLSQPLSSDPCQIDPDGLKRYLVAIIDLMNRTNAILKREVNAINGYNDGTVSLSEFAQVTNGAISDQESLYEEVKSTIPPQGMPVTHRKLIDGEFLALTALQAVYVYTQTLDTTYLDRGAELLQSGNDSLSEFNTELQQYKDQCKP